MQNTALQNTRIFHFGQTMFPLSEAFDEESDKSRRIDTSDEISPMSMPSFADNAEDKIAEAMKSLSFDEQRLALNDIHGVSDTLEEDPSFIDEKLREVEVELMNIPSKNAYYRAKAASPAYVCDRDFRLMFLRSDNFDARMAATRLVRHFDVKLDLFGEEMLGKPIRFSDLNELDVRAVESGFVQWLPQRDRAGRAILFWTPGSHVAPLKNRFRAQWYGMMKVLSDEETRKNGMVVIIFNSGGHLGTFDFQAAMRISTLSGSLPTRFVAAHACLDNAATGPILSKVLSALGNGLISRFRFHHGAPIQCLYNLMTFGIPTSILPVNSDGVFRVSKAHLDRMKKRIEQEKQMTVEEEKSLTFIPGRFDVLLGRHKLSQDHVGNLRYRELVHLYKNQYETASKKEKTSIADEIVSIIHNWKGRFLIEHYADFVEVPDAKAREKVAHCFRSLRQKGKSKNTPSSSFISTGIGSAASGMKGDGNLEIFSLSSSTSSRIDENIYTEEVTSEGYRGSDAPSFIFDRESSPDEIASTNCGWHWNDGNSRKRNKH